LKNPSTEEFPLFIFHQGKNYQSYKLMSPHKTAIDGEEGWLFHVWAPNAKSISVIGDFNGWDRKYNPMTKISIGVWECFIKDIKEFASYKFSIEQSTGEIVNKADPYALHSETSPHNASKLFDIDKYVWNDSQWMSKRKNFVPYNQPINIYEVHLGSWRTFPDGNKYTYRKLAEELIPYLVEMHYTHVELLPLTEFPYDGSWGYQVTGMFSATSRYGTPDDLMYFVDCCHQAGIGVILDWVAAHFPKDDFGLIRFDGAPLYEYEDPRKGEHPAWGTLVYDYGKNEVRSFLISSANFWCQYYHIDGLRADAVSSMIYLDFDRKDGEWIPNEDGGNINYEAISLLKELNTNVLKDNQGVLMIAEESTDYPNITKPPYDNGLGFNFKWNMGWMNDTLRYVSADPFFRKDMHNMMTFSLMYAYNENFILPLSHDEVVHGKCSLIGKMPGYYSDKFGGLMTYYGYMYAHPGKKLLFMGSEFAQFIEWNYKQGLDWLLLDYPSHKGMQTFVKDLNTFYCEHPCMWDQDTSYDGFRWLQVHDNYHNIYAFMRKGKEGDYVIAVFNYSSLTISNYWIAVPDDAIYETVLDSRNAKYNNGTREEGRTYTAEKGVANGQEDLPYHIAMDIDPFSMQYVVLKQKLNREKPKAKKLKKE